MYALQKNVIWSTRLVISLVNLLDKELLVVSKNARVANVLTHQQTHLKQTKSSDRSILA